VISLIKHLHTCLRTLIPYYGTIYRRIGGHKIIGTLVDNFYEIMQTDPKARECLATHEGRNIQESAAKLKAFLSGWLGGPQLYIKTYGHPRLRMRHFPFAIRERESEQWLYCMRAALQKSAIKEGDQAELLKAFEGLTNLIKNRD
jgi:hemoglobin